MSNEMREAQALKDVKEAKRLLMKVRVHLGNDHPTGNLLTVAIHETIEIERFIERRF